MCALLGHSSYSSWLAQPKIARPSARAARTNMSEREVYLLPHQSDTVLGLLEGIVVRGL